MSFTPAVFPGPWVCGARLINLPCRFLFAINTISMVKNDALFSYVAPGNIFAWLLMPFRYCMPLHHFVWLNRLVIKVTHFPLLFCIFFYERFWLASAMFEPTDLVENPGQGRPRNISFADPASRTAVFSPNVRVREESVAGFQKDRALDEVFRRVPEMSTLRTQRRTERRKTQNAIRNWMDQHEELGSSPANWQSLDSRAGVPEWARRYSLNPDRPHRLRQVSDVRSAASDPADLLSNSGLVPFPGLNTRRGRHRMAPDLRDQTDADGDDELVTNDEEEEEDNATNVTAENRGSSAPQAKVEEEDYFTTPMASRFQTAAPSSLGSSSQKSAGASPRSAKARRTLHSRTLSTNTILYNPEHQGRLPQSSSSVELDKSPLNRQAINKNLDLESPGTGKRSPRRNLYMANRPRQAPPPKGATAHPPPVAAPRDIPVGKSAAPRPAAGRRLSVDTGLVSDNTNLMLGGEDPNLVVPSSFQTQMAMAMMKRGMGGMGGMGDGAGDSADRDRMGRIMLARMKTLEESFADVVREMRELKSATAPPTRRNSSSENEGLATIEVAGRDRRKRAKGELAGRKRVAAAARRPVGNRGDRVKSGSSKDKGKGRAVESSGDEAGIADKGFTRRGSSF